MKTSSPEGQANVGDRLQHNHQNDHPRAAKARFGLDIGGLLHATIYTFISGSM